MEQPALVEQSLGQRGLEGTVDGLLGHARRGQRHPGDGLVILEAMKMENEFKAGVRGTVKEIRVEVGQTVNPGDVLLVIE